MPAAHLFTYGILMFPALVRAITGRDVAMCEAVLPGFRRRGLPHPDGAVFAAIDEAPGAAVAGKLLYDVTPAELALFDRVEELDTGYYVRREVTVEAAGEPLRAWAYVVGPAQRHALVGDWDPAGFNEAAVRRYIEEELPRLGIGGARGT